MRLHRAASRFKRRPVRGVGQHRNGDGLARSSPARAAEIISSTPTTKPAGKALTSTPARDRIPVGTYRILPAGREAVEAHDRPG
ncbi:hypothetical protein [Neoroseomonas marina]|uniref:hypothetical protein n=1 Tax=Neoroseomonas marina TaxID=1232220 RepID=UPI001B7D65E4|nr:hypothetical protein [Neoroseomonas marina]